MRLKWQFRAERHLYLWYGRVQIVGNGALGQWLFLDLDTGKCLWERPFRRVNTVRAVADGVIIASETRSDGPWTTDFGVYAIALQTGALLWRAHREGIAGRICDLLDLVPGFTNELRDRPREAREGEVLCDSGRVLDLHSGRLLRRMPVESPQARTGSSDLHDEHHREERIAVPGGELAVSGPNPREPERFVVTGAMEGREPWTFDIKDAGYFLRHWRVHGQRMFLVVSDEPGTVPIRADVPAIVRRVSRRCELWTLDTSTGSLLHKEPVGDGPVDECRIEDLNSHVLLISTDNKTLYCYGMEAEGKVAKQTGKSAWYARVRVACAVTEADPGPPACAGNVAAAHPWTHAAIAGVTWALEVAGVQAACTLTEVAGMPIDTNPTLVAIAAARATWASLAFTPDAALAARIDDAILDSHGIEEGRLGLPPAGKSGPGR